MKDDFIVVGYYTDGLYEKEAIAAAESTLKVGVPSYFHRIKDQGNWYKNTNHKPTFLIEMFEKYKKDYHAIVYVDVDARFQRYPELFDKLTHTNCPVAVHNFDRSCYRGGESNGFEVLSGTIYIQTTTEALIMLEKWERECRNHLGTWDQRNLENVLKGEFYNLPYQYCMIYDRYTDTKEPVIIHYQASRRSK
jgi:hypothetical protein